MVSVSSTVSHQKQMKLMIPKEDVCRCQIIDIIELKKSCKIYQVCYKFYINNWRKKMKKTSLFQICNKNYTFSFLKVMFIKLFIQAQLQCKATV